MYKDQQYNKILYFLVILISLLLLSGCFARQPVCEKDGKLYCRAHGSFTHEWYDYYERGLSCMQGGCYQQALSDLDVSLEKRPEDKREDEGIVLTYGMHLMNYFPHREKGVTYYHMGDYEAARSELERSIKEYPSSKAYQYLDKVRIKIMEKEKQAVSIPQIIVDPLAEKLEDTDEIWTVTDPLTISGMAEDRQYISEISVGGQPFYIEGSEQQIRFEKNLKLDDGRYEIDITARNLLKGEGKRKIAVYVDRSGPVISVKSFDSVLGLQGYLHDESGEISLVANGKEVSVPLGKDVPFSLTVDPGETSVRLLAEDKLGNQTQALINLEIIADSGTRKFSDLTSLETIHLSQDTSRSQTPVWERTCTQSSGFARRLSHLRWVASLENPILLAQVLPDTATDARGTSSKPVILLTDLVHNKKVYSDLLSVKGEVRGESNIKSVLVNNKPVYTRPGRMVFFNHSVRLGELGENKIVITARDESGRESVKKIIIIRKIREILKRKYRCPFKVTPFKSYEPGAKQNILIQYLFLNSLTARDRFRVVLRQELEDILQEQGFRLDRITSGNVGQNSLDSPLFMLIGHIFRMEGNLEIFIKAEDIRTGEIIEIINGYTEMTGRSGLEALVGILSEKLHDEFPMAEGKITHKDGERYFSDMKMKKEERINWDVVVGSDTEFVCAGNIDQIMDRGCWIRLSECNENRTIIGKWVATR